MHSLPVSHRHSARTYRICGFLSIVSGHIHYRSTQFGLNTVGGLGLVADVVDSQTLVGWLGFYGILSTQIADCLKLQGIHTGDVQCSSFERGEWDR